MVQRKTSPAQAQSSTGILLIEARSTNLEISSALTSKLIVWLLHTLVSVVMSLMTHSIQNIVKQTQKETNDSVDIRNALSVMTNIAAHINDMKRKHEHAVRVQEIQSLLYNWEVSPTNSFHNL